MSIGIQEAAALAACSCLDNQQGLQALRTLLANIIKSPGDEKYRSVSVAALEKRGMTPEGRQFLFSAGFVEDNQRLCFRPAIGPELFEGLAAIDDILEQRAQAAASSAAGPPTTLPESCPVAELPVADPSQALQQAGLGGIAPRAESEGIAPPSIHSDLEATLADMGFPADKIKESLSKLRNVDDVESVLAELLAQPETVDPQLTVQPQLGRAVSVESAAPDMPSLERQLSDHSREVLRAVFSAQGMGSVKEAARQLLALTAALQQGLLTDAQRTELQENILAGHVDIVREIIAGIGVQDSPEMMLSRGSLSWKCLICFDDQSTIGWKCSLGHQFCSTCMRQHIDAVSFPCCPMCDYTLGESDFALLNVPLDRIEAFREARLRGAVDTLAHGDESLVRCSRAECANVVVLPNSSGRQKFACGVCGAQPFCTRCRQAPYHHHSGCSRVQPLREQWLAWISGGRDDHHGRVRTAVEADRRNQALYEGIARHNELEADESWKAENCKLCPNCQRPISKVDGCDSMVCGRSYHGGDQQPGCGHEFNLASAQPYVAHIKRREVPAGVIASRLRGRDAFHPFTDCSLCGSCGIQGLRFRCIHCPTFDVCGKCEPRLGELHEVDHVFEIFFESDFRCPWLPRDTRVNIVRSGLKPPKSLTRCTLTELEGLSGKVVCRRRPPLEAYQVELDLGQGTVELDPEFLEPVITSREEAEKLLLRTLEEDGEEQTSQAAAAPAAPPAPAAAPPQRVEEDFADDSPLSDSSDNSPPRRRQRVVADPLRGGHRLGGRGRGRQPGRSHTGAYYMGEGLPIGFL